ncbi:MAG: hypothetical protein AB2651_19190 [Candidatus Thiodiazotropha sp.]
MPITNVQFPYFQYYFISAAHTLIEADQYHTIIYIEDSKERKFEINNKSIQIPSKYLHSKQNGFPYDFCLFAADKFVKPESLPCTSKINNGEVRIYGSPQGVSTDSTSIYGDRCRLAKLRTGGDVLEIHSQEISEAKTLIIDDNDGVVSNITYNPRAALAGMSGSPIIILDPNSKEEEICIGMFVGTSPDGALGRGYGVPFSTVRKFCEENKLIFYESDTKINHEASLVIAEELFADLSNPEKEQNAWDILSNIQYRGKGHTLDHIINEIIEDIYKSSIDNSVALYAKLFQAKFAIKKGHFKRGVVLLDTVISDTQQYRDAANQRLYYITQARKSAVMINDIEYSTIVDNIYKLPDRLAKIGLPDDYIITEVVSVFGWAASNFFRNNKNFIQHLPIHIEELIDMHQNFVKNRNDILRKQVVVATFLQAMRVLTSSDKSQKKVEKLDQLSKQGIIQSKELSNSIFPLQMVLLSSIVDLETGEIEWFYAKSLFVFNIMKQLQLQIFNEGINQLLLYVDIKYKDVYKTLKEMISISNLNDLNTVSEAMKKKSLNTKQVNRVIELYSQLLEGLLATDKIYQLDYSYLG